MGRKSLSALVLSVLLYRLDVEGVVPSVVFAGFLTEGGYRISVGLFSGPHISF